MTKNNKNELKAVDFFCGAGGMTYGMSKAGIRVLAGIDIDKECKATYEKNNPGSVFLNNDVTKMMPEELANKIQVKPNDDNIIFIGCSPCQYWSIINTNKDKSKKSKNLIDDFRRFIVYFRPGFVVVENVPGILRKKKDSLLLDFIKFLNKAGYTIDYKVLNLSEYGIPQSRKRFSFLASRIISKIELPKPQKNKNVTVREFIGKEKGFPSIKAGHKDLSSFLHSAMALSEKNLKRLKLTPKDGGNRFSWKKIPELQIKAYIGKDNSFSDVYGRMYWDKPAPTITTKFISISNGRFAHPEEDRALSLREGATLQTFPKKYIFLGRSFEANARLIGNAVPPEYAKILGKTILDQSKNI